MIYWQLPSKASGQDGISARMLKNTAHSIAPSITKLFNLSLSTGTIPSRWKKSLVVPIPKSQELSNPSHYRPVSLLPIISKVLERHIFMIVMDHLRLNHPLSAFQWGFFGGKINCHRSAPLNRSMAPCRHWRLGTKCARCSSTFVKPLTRYLTRR